MFLKEIKRDWDQTKQEILKERQQQQLPSLPETIIDKSKAIADSPIRSRFEKYFQVVVKLHRSKQTNAEFSLFSSFANAIVEDAAVS